MGRKKKFTEDDLLEAVVLYSDVEKGKIKATELAKWANTHISGMEDIRDYHFMRPIKEIKNGKKILRSSLSKQRIDEVNNARVAANPGEGNALLYASDIGDVLTLSFESLRKLIIRTRQDYHNVIKENAALRMKNLSIKEDNSSFCAQAEQFEKRLKSLEKEFNDIQHTMNYLTNMVSDNERRNALKKIGAEEGMMKLTKYRKSLSVAEGEMFDISKEIKKYRTMFEKKSIEVEISSDIKAHPNNSDVLNDDKTFKKMLKDIKY